eukprot:m.47037 g.47037  ORF g.47037 m.47037 type:complete len:603 (-) comp6836_c1_seq1:75-1883(-)
MGGRRGTMLPVSVTVAVLCSMSSLGAMRVMAMEPDCGEVPNALSAALASCDATSLTQLNSAAAQAGASADGSVLCGSECTTALATLEVHATDCTSSEFDAGTGTPHSLLLLNETRLTQHACRPPKEACVPLLDELVAFEQSSTGVQCRGLIERFTNIGKPDSVAQAENQVWCQGVCGTNLSNHLVALKAAGCSTWPAYRARKARYDPICAVINPQDPSQSSSSLSSNQLYCGAVFSENRFRSTIRSVRGTSGTVAQDEAELATMCTPCFYEYVRLTYRHATSTNNTLHARRLSDLESLCVRDSDRFCYPRVNDRVRASISAGVVGRAAALCDDVFLGRCAARIGSRHALSAATAADAAIAAATVETLCAVSDPHGTTSRRCLDVMAPVIGGYEATAAVSSQYNTSRQARYSGPSDGKCDGVRSTLFTCTHGCQTSLTVDRDQFGCCQSSVQSALSRMGFDGVDVTFAHLGMLQASCNRPSSPPCTGIGAVSKEAILIVPVPVEALRLAGAIEALVDDLQRAVGTTRAGITLRHVRRRDLLTSMVVFDVLAARESDAAAMITQLEADVTAGRIVFLETTRLYNSVCHLRDGRPCDPVSAPAIN